MKLAVIAVDRDRQNDVVSLLDANGVSGFSLIPGVLGRGETGVRFGTRAFPGDNAMIVALVTPDQLGGVRAGLETFAEELRPGQGLMAIALDAEQLV